MADKHLRRVEAAFPALVAFPSSRRPSSVACGRCRGRARQRPSSGFTGPHRPAPPVTWSINSICHVIGDRPFTSRDRSANVWWLAILSMGESWHNLHHADLTLRPTRCRPGQLDSSARLIWAFEKFGWASDVRWPRRSAWSQTSLADLMRLTRAAERLSGWQPTGDVPREHPGPASLCGRCANPPGPGTEAPGWPWRDPRCWSRADAIGGRSQGAHQRKDRTDLCRPVEDLLIGPVRAVTRRSLDDLDADRLVVQANCVTAHHARRHDLPHVPALRHDEVRAGAGQLPQVRRVVGEPVARCRGRISLREVQDDHRGVEPPCARAVVTEGVRRHLILALLGEVDELRDQTQGRGAQGVRCRCAGRLGGVGRRG